VSSASASRSICSSPDDVGYSTTSVVHADCNAVSAALSWSAVVKVSALVFADTQVGDVAGV
jgi:hypothetical protein